jgi:hypothetical protein
MNRLLFASVIFSITTLAIAQELPFLRPDKEYSGVRVVDTARGEVRQRINWTSDKMRTVTEMEGMRMTNIVRQDLGVMWIESPMMGGCFEQPLSETHSMLGTEQPEAYDNEHVEYRKLGEETVGGHDTTKYEVTSTEPGEPVHTALFWVTEDNIIVRMEVSGNDAAPDERFNMRLEELKTGPQPAVLFESPGQCMPMPVMPGMPGMPTMPDSAPGQN